MMKLLLCLILLCHCKFLDEQLARVRENENIESDNIDESDDEDLPVIPKGYVFEKEAALSILACKDRYELKRLLAKWKQQSLDARMNLTLLLLLHLSVLPIRIMNSRLILI